jgi:hypothetical protein
MSRFGSRVATTALVAVLGLMIPVAAVADAPDGAGVAERAVSQDHWLFAGDGLIVLEGPPLAEGCVGQFGEYATTVASTPAGVTITTSTHIDDVWVYDDEGLDPLTWLFTRGCSAAPPGPLAHGQGRVSQTLVVDADGVVRADTSTLTAQVTTAEGERVHLNVVGAGMGAFPDRVNYGG